MRLTDYLVSAACLASTASAFGRHAHKHGLLQLPRAFSREGIWMYPGLHPDHDSDDLQHLEPQLSKVLHYSQEGHRPAMHGAKHAELQSTFSSLTVALEHSGHIEDVVCEDDSIKVCFKTLEAYEKVEESWQNKIGSETFNLITYHMGCGDQTGDHRSFFRASNPVLDDDEGCVTVSVEPIDEGEAMHAGDLSWGTFQHPEQRKREAVKGHVQAVKPVSQPANATVDITKDAEAVQYFFNTTHINTDMPDRETEPLDFMDNDYSEELAKRGFWSWIVSGIKAVVHAIENAIIASITLIVIQVRIIVEYGIVVASLIMVPFGFPFDRAYHADVAFDKHTDTNIGIGSDVASALGGTQNGFVLAEQGTAWNVQCADCGARGNFSFDGRLAFSIAEGVTAAEIALINHDPFQIDAVLRINLNGRVLKNKDNDKHPTAYSKELWNVGLPGLWIPRIIALGPMVTIGAGVSLYGDGHMELVTGAKFQIDTGRLVLNSTKGGQNEASGFEPSAKWVMAGAPGNEIQGNAVATLDANLPVGIEFGIDVLLGKFKETVGVFFDPSVYFTAGLSINEGHKCDRGIEMRAGAKGRIYSSGLGIWEYQFYEWKLLEKGLGCLKWNHGFEFNADDVEPDIHLNKEVIKQLGDDIPSERNKTVLSPGTALDKSAAASKFDYHKEYEYARKHGHKHKKVKLPKSHGFRMIQDANMTSTLVSGSDGYIYLVDNSAEYDISSPWGALDVKKNIFTYDIFGRLIHWGFPDFFPSDFQEVMVSHGEAIPEGHKQLTLNLVDDEEDKSKKGNEAYMLSFKWDLSIFDPDKRTFNRFPTFCQIDGHGLRLYASIYLVKEDGTAVDQDGKDATRYYKTALERLKLGIEPTQCQTVRLVSDFTKKATKRKGFRTGKHHKHHKGHKGHKGQKAQEAQGGQEG